MKARIFTLLGLALLVIPAASPYFLPGVPRTNDLTPHLMRTFFWGEAVSYAGLWPRWSAELVFGYGYPVFNFFSSSFHAFVQLIHQFGLPLLTAYRVVVYLHFLVAAVSSYLMGKEILNSRSAGWGAAVIYVYSPYLLYDAIVRGAGPETQALTLLPLLILCVWKASEMYPVSSEQIPDNHNLWADMRQSLAANLQSPTWVVLTAVIFSLIVLAHPIAYQILIPIGIWLLIKAGFAGRNSSFDNHKFNVGRSLQSLVGPTLGIGLGGFVAAFYWLPAYLEIGYTRSDIAISQGYSYQANFLRLMDMLRGPVIPADPALINPPVVRALPVAALLWAAIIIIWRWHSSTRLQREIAAAWTTVLALTVWLITPTSVLVWDYFPLLRHTLYPWRFLGMAAMTTAVLVALSMQMIGDWRKLQNNQSQLSTLFPSFLLTSLILIVSIPWLFPPRQSMPENIDMATALDQELPPLFIGTTTLGEFLPRQVVELPEYLPEHDALRAGENPDRLQAAAGLTWNRLDENPVEAKYEVRAASPTTAVYRQFDFPGWQVTVDNEPVAITPSSPEGLITFPLPAGQHDVAITFGSTGIRWLGWIISALALAVILALAVQVIRHPRKETVTPQSPDLKAQWTIILGGTAVLIWLFFVFVDTPLHRSTLQADGILGKPVITPIDYAGEVRLMSYEAPAAPVAADELIPLTLYFQAQTDIGVPYNIGVQVVDGTGLNWMADDERPVDWRYIAEEPWPPDAYRMEPYLLSLMDGTPPGTYQFHVGLVRADTGQTVAAYDIGELFVGQPGTGEKPLEAGMVPPASQEQAAAGNLQLLGTRLDRAEAAPGDPVRVTTLWQALAPDAKNQFTLQLVSADEDLLLSEEVTIATLYPPEQWLAGDRLRSETLLRLPASLENGRYTWQLLWEEILVEAGTMQVNAPERNFKEVDVETAVGESFGDTATLIGINTHPQNSAVTLVWQAENETSTSYRVFVHLLDENDVILSQSDGEPVNWNRPTTGWLPHEILQDTHVLTFPENSAENQLQLRIGLYDPATGERLTTNTGDSITILLP